MSATPWIVPVVDAQRLAVLAARLQYLDLALQELSRQRADAAREHVALRARLGLRPGLAVVSEPDGWPVGTVADAVTGQPVAAPDLPESPPSSDSTS